jgi:uncharacterized membrane protein
MTNSHGKVWFDAHIKPNAALSARGFALVGLAILAPSVLFGGLLSFMGAWPATVFLGAEALLALVALFWCAKRLRDQGERVVLTDDALIIESWDEARVVDRTCFEPSWLRVERRVDPNFGCEAVIIRSRQDHVRIGQALSPPERDSLASALEHALRQRKAGAARRFT